MASDVVSIRRTVEPVGAEARGLLRRLVLAATGESEEAQKRTTAMLDGLDDSRLMVLANESLANLQRIRVSFDEIDGGLKEMRRELERSRNEHKVDTALLAEAEKAIKERDDIAAKYQELKKQVDPEKHQIEIMYAIDEAKKEQADEVVALKRELGQRLSEVNELKASKKRLREALDRLAGKT